MKKKEVEAGLIKAAKVLYNDGVDKRWPWSVVHDMLFGIEVAAIDLGFPHIPRIAGMRKEAQVKATEQLDRASEEAVEAAIALSTFTERV